MTTSTSAGATREAVDAAVTYLVNTGRKPVTHIASPGVPSRREAEFEDRVVSIRNARLAAPEAFSLEREGFLLTRHETAVRNFYDTGEVKAVYDKEIERLVKDFTGASHVLVFDHTIRVSSEKDHANKQLRQPVRVTHNDYTERSGPQRVRDLLPPGEAEERLKRRFAIVQVWRSVGTPVKRMPLAILDSRSIGPDDLIAADLIYQDRIGEIYQVAYNAGHRWYYYPGMARTEALIFKCYDSLNDGRSRFTAHTAFDDPGASPDAPQRESIETRTLAFF